MRLWHEELIAFLPRQQLLGQHRECCALRGNGWGKRHATVDYVFTYSPYKLYQYHCLIMTEMRERGYHPNDEWFDANFRGQVCLPYDTLDLIPLTHHVYPEHNKDYKMECLDNLRQKHTKISSEEISDGRKYSLLLALCQL